MKINKEFKGYLYVDPWLITSLYGTINNLSNVPYLKSPKTKKEKGN